MVSNDHSHLVPLQNGINNLEKEKQNKIDCKPVSHGDKEYGFPSNIILQLSNI